MGIGKTRGFLYRLARAMGDWQALSSGRPDRIAKRVGRRIVGRLTGRALWRLFK